MTRSQAYIPGLRLREVPPVLDAGGEFAVMVIEQAVQCFATCRYLRIPGGGDVLAASGDETCLPCAVGTHGPGPMAGQRAGGDEAGQEGRRDLADFLARGVQVARHSGAEAGGQHGPGDAQPAGQDLLNSVGVSRPERRCSRG